MRHYLVVANQTIESPQLLEAIKARMDEGPSSFHLLVPEDRGHRMTWDEGRVKVEAQHRLDFAIEHFRDLGIAMTGDIDTTPVDGVFNVLHRQGADHFDEILLSTLPETMSKWLKMDALSRIRRMTSVPVTHLAAVLTAS